MISVPPLIPNNKICTGIRKWHGIGENAAYFCAISSIIGHFNSINLHHHEKTAKMPQRRKPEFHHPREHHPDVITPQRRGTRTAYPAVLSLRRTRRDARRGAQPCITGTGKLICFWVFLWCWSQRTNRWFNVFYERLASSYPDYAMKGGKPDKFRGSAFSLSLQFRHFPDKCQK